MAKKLYVGNLPFSVTQAQIRELFSQVGDITEINLIEDRMTGTPKGFGFVEMATEAAAQQAIQRFNGYALDGHNLVVNEARPREERSRSGGSFSGRSGRGNRRF